MQAKAALTWAGGTSFRGWDGCRFSALLLWWCNLVARNLALIRELREGQFTLLNGPPLRSHIGEQSQHRAFSVRLFH